MRRHQGGRPARTAAFSLKSRETLELNAQVWRSPWRMLACIDIWVKQNERSLAVGKRYVGDRIRHRDVGCRAIVHRKQGKQVGEDSVRARRANCFFSPMTILRGSKLD